MQGYTHDYQQKIIKIFYATDEFSKKYEEEIQKLNLSKAVRVQIDRYVSAVNWRWVLCWDFLCRSGMKDILLLFENR